MALVTILEETLTNIANAIRDRNGQDTKYKVSEMGTAIDNLHTEKYQPRAISFQNYSGDNLNYELGNLDISRITNMNHMFSTCLNLTTLDVSQWDVSKVTDMSYMFDGCNNLTTLDVSNWDVSKVTNMSSIFGTCLNLATLDVSKWDVSKVTDMHFMFSTCNKLTALDLSKWDVSNVTDMSYIFNGCNHLTTLDLSNWDVSKVTDMNHMFSGDWFSSLPLSDNSLKSVLKMLKTATSLSASNKNLKYLSLTSDQATKCTTFTEWNDLVALGWSTGY